MSQSPTLRPNVYIYTAESSRETSETRHVKTSEGQEYQVSGSTMAPRLYPVTSHPPQFDAHLVLGNSDYDIACVFKEALQKSLRASNIETVLAEVKAKAWEFTFEAENFLRNNEALIPFLDRILSTIRYQLTVTGGLLSGFIIQKWSDTEVAEMEDIEVIVKVDVTDHDKLLRLWEMVDEEIYQNLPSEVSKKIVVSFELL